MSKLNKKIRLAASKDPNALIADLTDRLAGSYPSLDKDVREITRLLEEENTLNIERKKISRLIGAARKSGENPAAHIAEVSELSQRIKQQSDQIDEIVARIDTAIGVEKIDSQAAAALEEPDKPGHLIVVSGVTEIEVNTLKHEPLTDIDAWQSFVATQERPTYWCISYYSYE